MTKKIISALCVLFLTFGFVSCQKSKVDQYMDINEEMFVSCQKSKVDQYMDINEEIVDIMGEIHDTKSADKYADKLIKLLDERMKVSQAMTEQDTAGMASRFEEGIKMGMKMQPDTQRIQNNQYYNSEKLRQLMQSGDFHL